MAEQFELDPALANAHQAALARECVRRVLAHKGEETQDHYLGRCREFGLLVRAHGLTRTLEFWVQDKEPCRQQFACDAWEVLRLWDSGAGSVEAVAKLDLDRYLVLADIALDVADLFKRYANALLVDPPDWAIGKPGEAANEVEHA